MSGGVLLDDHLVERAPPPELLVAALAVTRQHQPLVEMPPAVGLAVEHGSSESISSAGSISVR